MKRDTTERLSRRERQILDVLHRIGRGSVGEVLGELSDPPSYSTVRTLLRIMEKKGLVTHAESRRSYVYTPAMPSHVARRSALRHVVSTFFEGSVEQAAAALLNLNDSRIDPETRRRLKRRISQARREGG